MERVLTGGADTRVGLESLTRSLRNRTAVEYWEEAVLDLDCTGSMRRCPRR